MSDSLGIDRFEELLDMADHGPDVFVARTATYPWGRVYGGQVAAQALQAAALTVDDEFSVHSLHGYFIRGGTSDEPIRFEVDRIRNGRSFATRRVVARQSGGAIFNLSTSFQRPEDGVDVQPPSLPPGVPLPDDLPADDWSSMIERRSVPADALPGRTAAWLRVTGPLDRDAPATDECGLVFLSDDVPYDTAARIHPDWTDWDHTGEPPFVGATLDHSVWFHRQVRADEWQLHVLDGMAHTGNRGLAFGQVFALDGTHLASVAQEIVHRRNHRR